MHSDRLRTYTVLREVAMIVLVVLFLMLGAVPAMASCDSTALGTERTISVEPGARVGRKHFPATLPLAPKEIVLTFDDGPWPGTTDSILAALRAQCVKATFFMLGRSAASWPQIARRVAADGHTIGHHTYSHPLLRYMTQKSAEAEIDRGIRAIEDALGNPGTTAAFFRFPGFASSPALLDLARQRGMAVFGADVWASDWDPMGPDTELRLILQRIEASHGGIVLFHDTKKQTAAMLPAFLRALKQRGYRVVQVVPQAGGVAPPGAGPLRRSW